MLMRPPPGRSPWLGEPEGAALSPGLEGPSAGAADSLGPGVGAGVGVGVGVALAPVCSTITQTRLPLASKVKSSLSPGRISEAEMVFHPLLSR